MLLLHALHLALVPVTPPKRSILSTPSWPPNTRGVAFNRLRGCWSTGFAVRLVIIDPWQAPARPCVARCDGKADEG